MLNKVMNSITGREHKVHQQVDLPEAPVSVVYNIVNNANEETTPYNAL